MVLPDVWPSPGGASGRSRRRLPAGASAAPRRSVDRYCRRHPTELALCLGKHLLITGQGHQREQDVRLGRCRLHPAPITVEPTVCIQRLPGKDPAAMIVGAVPPAPPHQRAAVTTARQTGQERWPGRRAVAVVSRSSATGDLDLHGVPELLADERLVRARKHLAVTPYLADVDQVLEHLLNLELRKQA